MERNNKIIQCELVLSHLQRCGSLTPKTAEEQYGIMRLGARIYDLRKKGYLIETQHKQGKNRYGRKTRYANYKLL